MDRKLVDGDYVRNSAGRLEMVTGPAELLQQALFCLSVKQGAFSLLPGLGSRLYTLTGRENNLREKAVAMAKEALSGIQGLSVRDAEVTGAGSGRMRICFSLAAGDGESSLAVNLRDSEQ